MANRDTTTRLYADDRGRLQTLVDLIRKDAGRYRLYGPDVLSALISYGIEHHAAIAPLVTAKPDRAWDLARHATNP